MAYDYKGPLEGAVSWLMREAQISRDEALRLCARAQRNPGSEQDLPLTRGRRAVVVLRPDDRYEIKVETWRIKYL